MYDDDDWLDDLDVDWDSPSQEEWDAYREDMKQQQEAEAYSVEELADLAQRCEVPTE